MSSRQCPDIQFLFAGLAALASSSEGIAAIYAAKRRQLQSPLAICVGDAFDIPRYAETEHLPRGCNARVCVCAACSVELAAACA
jgi:Telomere recombination